MERMSLDLSLADIPTRFDHLLRVIGSERFLKMESLGNEVPFFICPYDPHEAVEMQKLVEQLARRLRTKDVHVVEIDLYDLAVELLQERGIWEQVLETEPSVSKAELLELLQGVLDPEHHLVPAIAERVAREACDVLFLTGVGEVFPYIRSHNVLNNLQSAAKAFPTVLFFPGKYEQSLEAGASLCLFGRLPDDKYYRAFNIYTIDA
jgi:Domain of unknown function (DUF1788)